MTIQTDFHDVISQEYNTIRTGTDPNGIGGEGYP